MSAAPIAVLGPGGVGGVLAARTGAVCVGTVRTVEAIRARGLAEVPSHEVGLAILGPLRDLDEVAYLRFASVYRGFESLDDFEKAITELRGRLADAGSPRRSRSS